MYVCMYVSIYICTLFLYINSLRNYLLTLSGRSDLHDIDTQSPKYVHRCDCAECKQATFRKFVYAGRYGILGNLALR